MSFLQKNIPLWVLVLAILLITAGVVLAFYLATGSQPITFSWGGLWGSLAALVVLAAVFMLIAKYDKRLGDIFKEYRRKK